MPILPVMILGDLVKHWACPLRLPSPELAQEPVRQVDHLCADALVPLAALVDVLNGVANDLALAIKLKDEEPRKLALGAAPLRSAEGLVELLLPLLRQARVAATPRLLPRRRPPLDHELLRVGPLALGRKVQRLRRHALREDLDLEVADDGHAVPGNGRRPHGRRVGHAARDRRQVRVRRREEVEGDVGREDLLRQRRLQDRGEALL